MASTIAGPVVEMGSASTIAGICAGVVAVVFVTLLVVASLVVVRLMKHSEATHVIDETGDNRGSSGETTEPYYDSILPLHETDTPTDQVVATTNPAYGVEVAFPANLVAKDGVAVTTNPAHKVTTDGVAVFANVSVFINLPPGVAKDEVAVTTNPAYGIATDGVAVSNPPHRVDEIAVSTN